MKRFLFLACLVASSSPLFSQSVVRGPYLQTPTHESIIVMWRTDQPMATKLWYGSSPDSLEQVISLNNNVIDHIVTISGLTPYTTYYYAVGTDTTVLAGNDLQHRFRTHPLPGTEQPIRVWAIGDFGKGNEGQIAVKQSYMEHPGSADTDVWMWLGDNAYQDGKDSEYQSKVFGLSGFSDVFNWLPFYPTPGNHDYNEVWSQSTFLGIPYSNIPLQNHQGPYFDIVEVPQQAEAGGFPSQLEVFYSFDHGNVHFLSLNSEVFDFLMTNNGIDQMVAWLEQDLAQNEQLFTVAYFHQPPYSKGSHDSDDFYELVMKAMRERVIPALEGFDIDLVICGHSHVFERSHLIHGHYGGSSSYDPATMLMDGNGGNFDAGNPYIKDALPSTADGTVYVVCGNSGSSNSDGSLNHPVMAYADGGSTAYGSFVMDFYRNRVDGRYLKVDGSIGDHFTLLKKNMQVLPLMDVVLCTGESAVLTAQHSGGSDEVSYSWPQLQSTEAQVAVSPTESSTYTLIAIDALTGQEDSTTVTVTVLELPVPEISFTGDSLFAQPGFSYQWYLDGEPVPDATEAYHVPQAFGTYTVELSNGNCAVLSDGFFLSITGIAQIPNSGLRIFPNPTDGLLTVVLDTPWEAGQLSLLDARGRVMVTQRIAGDRVQLNLAGLSAGSYRLVLEQPEGRRSATVVLR